MTLVEEIKQKAQVLRDRAAKDIAESDRLLSLVDSLSVLTDEHQKAIKEYFFPNPPPVTEDQKQHIKEMEDYFKRQLPARPFTNPRPYWT